MPSSGDGFVYVLRFSDGDVKVGLTRDLRKRMQDLSREAAYRSSRIEARWFSPRHPAFRATEATLLAYAAARYARARGREYFANADFDDLVVQAEALLSGMEIPGPPAADPDPWRELKASLTLMTPEEIADFANVDRKIVIDWCRTGVLGRAVKLGGTWRISPLALNEPPLSCLQNAAA